jgi:DNA-binding GntR family transcriptional regulator
MPSGYPKVKLHKTKMQLVYDYMKESIVRGRWKAGERRNANEIAKELNVSRTPVIDVSRVLEREGYLRILPQIGLVATQLTPQEVEEVFLIRGALLGLATAEASQHLQKEDLLTLERLLAEMKAASAAGQVEEFIRLNRKFHQAIYRSCRLPSLIAEVERFWSSSSRYTQLFRQLPLFYNSSIEKHEAILRALKRRDYAAAKSAAEEDTVYFGRALADYLRRNPAGQ